MVGASEVPEIRITAINTAETRPDGDYVLYWMIAARRTRYNFALQRALEHAREFQRPLVVLEGLRVAYPYASDRMHRFAIQGMAENARAFHETPIHHYPYVEPDPGSGSGLLEALAERACVVVTDEFPEFFFPRMLRAVAPRLKVRLEQIDGLGLLPLRAADKAYSQAYHFRRFLQKELPVHLDQPPMAEPLEMAAGLPKLDPGAIAEIEARYPPASPETLAAGPEILAALPIDHAVTPVAARGGSVEARRRLDHFVREGLVGYAERRREVESRATSGLSPWLHWGFISPHEILEAVAAEEGWTLDQVSREARGSRRGWWAMSEGAESFLDELVTWRELGINTAFRLPNHSKYRTLPEWALETLEAHAGDPRPHLYRVEALEASQTSDALWNAAQGELRAEGRIHSYLRMLWGKAILAWTEHPAEALEMMGYLNNRWALDGRDPNSWSGIFWCLGRYDRPWGPERPIYGKVRYMTSKNTARKMKVDGYIAQYGNQSGQASLFPTRGGKPRAGDAELG